MEAADIERYLAELGAELKNRGLKKPVRIFLTRRGIYASPRERTSLHERYRHLLARRRWSPTSVCSATREYPGYQTETRSRCYELLHLNTHLDHISREARIRGTEVILHRLHLLHHASTALLVTGDFNCSPDDPVHHLFQAFGFADAYLATGHEENEQAHSFHAYGRSQSSSSAARQRKSRRLDWILFTASSEGIRPLSCEIIREAQPPVYPSDHYPVVAEFDVP